MCCTASSSKASCPLKRLCGQFSRSGRRIEPLWLRAPLKLLRSNQPSGRSVAAVAPLLGAKFDASLADIGLLIGLYSTPGVVLSLPGGVVGKRIGDKTTVAGALMLMLIGQLAMVASDSWGWQIAGRL